MADHPLTLGEIIRRQRELAEVPMRQLAAMTGISNPYLSQIENGLREPSNRVLTALAEALQVSVDDLRAATESSLDDDSRAVLEAINSDPNLTKRQRVALIEAYSAMVEVTLQRRHRRT
ncbi:MAG: transcriptional regulator [Micrococcales bacterium]|nr:MAG: transcriptional regulator [Micrococcales bacterium]